MKTLIRTASLLTSLLAASAALAAEPTMPTPTLAPPRARMTVEGADLQFFPEIAKTLEDLTVRAPGDTIQPAPLSCPAHQSLVVKPPALEAGTSWSCSTVAAAWQTLRQTNSVCQEIQDPVGYFASLPVKDVEITRMNDLEEVIRTFAPAIVRMDEAESLRKQVYVDQLQSILVKLRLTPLRQRIEQRRQAILQVNKNLLKGGSCLTGAPADQSAATMIFAQALTETEALLVQLANIEKAGLALAKRDADAVRAQGRQRDVLPYPSMTDSERRFLSYMMSAFLWRARGGGIFFEPAGTNHRRLAFTLMPMREIARLNGGDNAVGLGTSLWLGLFAPWGHIHDYGRLDGDKWTDYAAMKVRGAKQVERVVGDLQSLGYNSTAFRDAGDMMAHCYWYGWERMAKINMGMNLTTLPFSAVSGVATNWGEFCTGATMGVVMSEALLAGH